MRAVDSAAFPLLAECVEKVEKFVGQNFSPNPIQPGIAAAISIEVLYSVVQGDARFLTVPSSQNFEPPASEAESFPPTSKKDFFNDIGTNRWYWSGTAVSDASPRAS